MQQTVTTAPARRSRALIALAAVIGLLVAIAAYSYGSASDRTPTARVQMVLDEDQTGWPFYAAVQEEAESFLSGEDALQAARDQAGVSGGELRVERPGDLSVFSVVASASDDDAAMALADAGAAHLIERSQESRRSTERGELTALEERRSALDGELDAISATVDALDSADQSAEAVLARSSLESVGRERNDVDRAIGDLETAIDATGPAYRTLGPAAIEEQTTSALLTALTAGAAAAVLSLLALSFLAGPASAPPLAGSPAENGPTSAAGTDRTEEPTASEPARSIEPDTAREPGASPKPVARSSAFGPPSSNEVSAKGPVAGKASSNGQASPSSTKPKRAPSSAEPPKKPGSSTTSPSSANGRSKQSSTSTPDAASDSKDVRPAKRSKTRRSDRKR